MSSSKKSEVLEYPPPRIVVKEEVKKNRVIVTYGFPRWHPLDYKALLFKLGIYGKISREQHGLSEVDGVILTVKCPKCKRYLNLGETRLDVVDGVFRLRCRYCLGVIG